jgi:ketosteroid isomerase-like protein
LRDAGRIIVDGGAKRRSRPMTAEHEIVALIQRWAAAMAASDTDSLVAFVRGVEYDHLRPRSGGPEVEQSQRSFTLIRREADGRWRFARGMTNQARK